METVQINLNKDIFEKLQKMAEPLIDDINSVIQRLIHHYESSSLTPEVKMNSRTSETTEFWMSNRGEQFIVGTKLRANYKGKPYYANIEIDGINFEGKIYDSPSAAGIAVKKSAGTSGTAANTDGWSFWVMLEPGSNQWISINTIRFAK